MKSLDEAEVVGEASTAKKTVPDGKNRAAVVLVHGSNITVQEYKRKSGWTLNAYNTQSIETWKRLAQAIVDLTGRGDGLASSA